MFATPIQALTFDAAGTLIHLVEPVGVSYSRVASEFGIESAPTEIGSAFGAVWKRTPLPFADQARHEDPNEKAWWHRFVREVFIEGGARPPDESTYDAFFEALYLHFESPGTWKAEEAAEETLEKLSHRFRCIVLSNFDSRLRKILTDLGLIDFFETCLLSCELGASKPDPAVFEAAANWFQLAPSQILHVGDDPVCDWQGSKAAGFAHFRIGKAQNKFGDIIEELSLAHP